MRILGHHQRRARVIGLVLAPLDTTYGDGSVYCFKDGDGHGDAWGVAGGGGGAGWSLISDDAYQNGDGGDEVYYNEEGKRRC